MIYPSTADFRAIVSAGGISGCKVTPEDVKAAEVILGQSVLKMKANTMKRNGMRVAQSIIKVLKELIKLQQDVELAIDCFFVNKHIFFTTYSTKICFTMVTHLSFRTKALILEVGSPSRDVQDVPPMGLPNRCDCRGSRVQLDQSPDCEPPDCAQNRLGSSITKFWPH
jgi:hypothetical protein